MPTNHVISPLPREFYLRDANMIAPELLGKLLVHRSPEGITSGMIVEVESYVGPSDKGAHSYANKRTSRTEIQFGPGGYAYVYAIYGMHVCFNVVANGREQPEVVLIRALEPVGGLELMERRRGIRNPIQLCNGPGKLCQAMGITKAQYGWDLCGPDLYLAEGHPMEVDHIMVSPRINIDYAGECGDYLWRYFIKDNPYVSKVAKRYRTQQRPYRREAAAPSSGPAAGRE